MRKTASLGYFGNIWVRQNLIEKAGDSYQGHTHHFDHVSLLVSGKALVEVEGHSPKEFTAPTFIVIRKEVEHKFTALEDNTVWFCIFALRDIDGEVVEDLYGPQHDPLHEWRKLEEGTREELLKQKENESKEEYAKRMLELDEKTTQMIHNAAIWNENRKKKMQELRDQNTTPDNLVATPNNA